jgi:hypothetical protein
VAIASRTFVSNCLAIASLFAPIEFFLPSSPKRRFPPRSVVSAYSYF